MKIDGREVVMIIAEQRWIVGEKRFSICSLNIHFNKGPSLTFPALSLDAARGRAYEILKEG